MTEEEFIGKVEWEGGLVEYLDHSGPWNAPECMREVLVLLHGAYEDAQKAFDEMVERVEAREAEDAGE